MAIWFVQWSSNSEKTFLEVYNDVIYIAFMNEISKHYRQTTKSKLT